MSKKNNYYYKKKGPKKKQEKEKKVTYDSLVHANTISEVELEKEDNSKALIFKYIAVTIVLFAIIFGSILLFRQM